MKFNALPLSLAFYCTLFFALTACSGQSENASTTPAPTLSSEQRLALPPDAENGARLFLACAVCHDRQEGQAHRVGPNLWGIYGAPAARHADFAYSAALRNSGIIWDDETLDAYLERPVAVVPRGRMAYAGEPDAANRRDMIAFLKTLQ